MVGVIEHARACRPGECVGLLIGRDEVDDFIPLCNVHPVPQQAFALDEAEVALHVGKGVVGLYHSHPNGGGKLSVWDDASGFEFYWIIEPASGKIFETRRKNYRSAPDESRPS